VPFSCRGRSFCPSCEKKKSLLWAEWLREEVLAPVPHRHVVVTIPRLLRGIFRKRRELLLDLSQSGAEALAEYIRRELGEAARPGIVVSIATAGDLLRWHPQLHVLTTDGGFNQDGTFSPLGEWDGHALMEWLARMADHIPDPGRHRTLFYAFYANRVRGERAAEEPGEARADEQPARRRRCPASWARLISKVFQADPLACRKCGGKLKIIAYLTDGIAIGRILDSLPRPDPA
jgi:hypothetical protein